MSGRPRVGNPAAGGLVGIGMFAGRVDPQQAPEVAIAQGLTDSMAGDPGVRLAGRGRRRFRAGGLTPQRFVGSGPGGVNSEEALEVLPVSAGNRSRALGQAPKLLPGDLPLDKG